MFARCHKIPISSSRVCSSARPNNALRPDALVHQRRHASDRSTADRIIFSGIQPTGIPHLGNYLGALRQWVQLQNDAVSGTKFFYSVVDLHAITVFQEPQQLRKWRRETLATLVAIGIDPERSTLFYQSSVSWTYAA